MAQMRGQRGKRHGFLHGALVLTAGMAVVKACQELRERIIDKAAKYLECSPDELAFDGRTVRRLRAAGDGLGSAPRIATRPNARAARMLQAPPQRRTPRSTRPRSRARSADFP